MFAIVLHLVGDRSATSSELAATVSDQQQTGRRLTGDWLETVPKSFFK